MENDSFYVSSLSGKFKKMSPATAAWQQIGKNSSPLRKVLRDLKKKDCPLGSKHQEQIILIRMDQLPKLGLCLVEWIKKGPFEGPQQQQPTRMAHRQTLICLDSSRSRSKMRASKSFRLSLGLKGASWSSTKAKSLMKTV